MIASVLSSIPRKYRIFLTLVVGALIVLGFGIAQRANEQGFRVRGQHFSVEWVTSPEAQRQGLSGRDNIDAKQVMLFAFDAAGERCFWMQDMKFNIDIVWIGSDKKVVALKENVSPDTYPESFCYDNAQYVAEFAAGTVQKTGLKSGDKVSF